jgi:hypothetical protein
METKKDVLNSKVIPEGLPREDAAFIRVSMARQYLDAVERHFQTLRGTPGFLLTPSDWKLVERWQGSSIPLAVVLRGLDAAFRKHQARRGRFDAVNSLVYCAPHVLAEWTKMRENSGGSGTATVHHGDGKR